jgi:hypothetical protein
MTVAPPELLPVGSVPAVLPGSYSVPCFGDSDQIPGANGTRSNVDKVLSISYHAS